MFKQIPVALFLSAVAPNYLEDKVERNTAKKHKLIQEVDILKE
jgi:hypothetical protein